MSAQPLSIFLWFNGQAEEAAGCYASVFDEAEVLSVSHLGPDGGMAMVNFTIRGTSFTALDGGPMYQLSSATSFVVSCDTQEEIDHYWTSLGEGGEPLMCGWLKDRFGVTWQIVPSILGELMSDPLKAPKVTAAFMKMQKFEIAELIAASAS